jgi:hypothetical protein
MLFANIGLDPVWAIVFQALGALVVIVGVVVDAKVLQGACWLLNKIAPGPRGIDCVPIPRFGQALAMIVLAGALHSALTYLVICVRALILGPNPAPEPGEIVAGFLLGFIAMSVVTARLLDAKLWRSAVVMVAPSALALLLVIVLFSGWIPFFIVFQALWGR